MKPPRGLDPEEKAVWRRVAATVKPMPGRKRREAVVEPAHIKAPPPPVAAGPRRIVEPMTPAEWTVGSKAGRGKSHGAAGLTSTGHAHPSSHIMQPGAASLDGGWDRRFRRGAIRPERSIDLHGYTLDQAHALLERALADALADDVRVLLLITGKERPEREAHGDAPWRRRGIIRASIADWLTHSRHASMIAAVRGAHPRDGGKGALYVILRRKRG